MGGGHGAVTVVVARVESCIPATWEQGWKATNRSLLMFVSSRLLLILLFFLSSSWPSLHLLGLLLLIPSFHVIFFSSWPSPPSLVIFSSYVISASSSSFSSWPPLHVMFYSSWPSLLFFFSLPPLHNCKDSGTCSLLAPVFQGRGVTPSSLAPIIPQPAAAMSVASVDVPRAGWGCAWSRLPRPPPLQPCVFPRASKDQWS